MFRAKSKINIFVPHPPMKLDNPFLTINEIQRLFQKIKAKHSQGPESFLASTCGLVVDASNYLAQAQKITLIDHTNQEQTIDVLLQGSQEKDFAVQLAIGDILHVQNFVFIMHEGKIVAYQGEVQSKMTLIPGYRQDAIQAGKDSKQLYTGLGATEVQIRILKNFGHKYFSNEYIPLQDISKPDLNPEQKVKQNKYFDIIARVVRCEEVDHSFLVTMKDQQHKFVIKFSRYIDIGVYKVRGIVSMKICQDQVELTADLSTNFIKIGPWMRSYNLPSPNKILNKSNETTISTNLLPNFSYPKKTTLKKLLNKAYHLTEVIVACEILDIKTSFAQAFKKLNFQEQDNHYKYRELDYKAKQGMLITNINLVITDPSMQGETMNVYLYPYDGRGKEFIPELDPFEIQDRIINEETLIQQKYLEFVNMVLEKTSFEDTPLELILSPMRCKNQSTVYRIVDTQVIINN